MKPNKQAVKKALRERPQANNAANEEGADKGGTRDKDAKKVDKARATAKEARETRFSKASDVEDTTKHDKSKWSSEAASESQKNK